MSIDENRLNEIRSERARAKAALDCATEGMRRRRSLRQRFARFLLWLLLRVDPNADERLAQLRMRSAEADSADAHHRAWMFALRRHIEYEELLETEFQAAGLGLFEAAEARVRTELKARPPVVNDLEHG